MKQVKLFIEGIKPTQANELLEDLRTIPNVDAGHYIRESAIEVKEIVVPILIGLGTGVSSGLITHYILKFLEKEKSIDNKPIIIRNSEVKIVQGNSKEEVQNQVNIIFK